MRNRVIREGQGIANRKFTEVIQKDFQQWAQRRDQSPSPENFLIYLMRRKIVEAKTINYFLIQHIYKKKRQEGHNKKQSISLVEETVPYKSRRILQCLDQYANRFFEKNIPFDEH